MFLFAFAALGAQAATVATVDGTGYETLEAAIAAAEPVDGVVTYKICGKAEVSATGWIQVLKSGLSNVKKVAFVGTTEDAEICIAGDLAILADQQYDIDVSFRNLKLSKPNPKYGGDYGHSTNYFTTWLRNTGAAENTVTYENCTFPNGACNNQYGKTVYTNCTFANGTTGLYNLWIYGGSVEMDGGVFTGTRGMKVYTEETPATAPSVEVKRTAFSGLTEKAAIVVSKAATVKFAEVSVAGCSKGLFQKDIEGSSDNQKVTVTANGSKISGSFAITANKEPETAKTEFNITGGMFTAEVPSDYCADGFTVTAKTDADGNTVYGVVEKTELVNYVTLELVFGDNVANEDVVAAKALYEQKKYETCKAANEAYMALFGVTWKKGKEKEYLDVTDNTAPLYKYAGRSGSVSEVRFYIHGTLAGFTSLQSSGNQIDCTVGGNHQISRTSYSIIGVDGADGKAKLTDGNVQAYVAGGYASMFTASGKLTIDNIEFTSTTSTTVGASATRATENDTENEVASAEMEIKNCTFRGRLYVYDNFENQGKMTYSIHNCVFDGSNYSGDSNAYAIFAQCKGGNNLVIKDNAIAGFARGINIDHANVHATIEGNTISVTDTGRSCIQLSSLATANIVGNTLELTGGNAITLHEKLLTLSAAPKVSISGNKVTGKGYLVYDDAKANDKEFTSDNLKLTYATDNTVAATVDTTQGVKDATKYELSGTVATTLHSVDFAAFVKALTDAGYTFDGSTHALAQNGKLTVKWSPVSGCYDTREGHDCTVGNVAATANTPKRVNSGLTQFQLFEGESHAVNVKNVAFVYEPAAFTVCENSGWQGTFTAAQAPAGQIFLMNTGDVTFEGCSFDKVVLTSFNCTGTSTVKNCSFKDVYNSYAVKDIRGKKVAVTGCTFENCGAAVMVSMVSSTVKVGAVTISGNNFKNVDVVGTAPDDKVGTRGLVQIASSGDYADTAFDFSGNKAEACGPVLRQLNSTVSFGTAAKAQLNTLASAGGSLYTTDSIKRVVAKVGETSYETLDEAIKAVQDGETIVVNAGEYKLNGNLTYTGKAFTIQAAEDATVSFDMSEAVVLHSAKITFTGVTFDYKTNGNYIGLQHADTLVYNDCTVKGQVFLYAASETFNRCTFTQTAVDRYNVWTYGAKAVTFNGCTFNCAGKSVLVYNEGYNSKTELAVSDCEFKASAPVEGKAAIEIDTSLMGGGGATITVDAKTTAKGFAEGSNSKSTLWNDKKQTQDTNTNTTVTVAGETVFTPIVAQVGEKTYTTLAAALAALSAENHTLMLLKENAWDAATPVYWAAGTKSGYAATLTEALTAAYKADAGAITIVCRPGADVGTMTHGHVADDLTIYGNDAFISDGECDLEVDQYKYSRATGAQAADGAYLEKDITITAYELDNLGVWGQRHTAHKVTVNLTDCDGKTLEGKTNVQRVYISGTTGVNNITLTDCDFLTKATAVYSNADGAIKAVNCSFTDGQVPFNINHKANGTQTVAVENCRFTNCGDAAGDWKQFAAPLRLVNSGTGTQSAEVTGCAFAGTVGANGDILLGDGRTGQASNDVELKVVKTAAHIQAQKPGYYGGETVDETKKATAESPAEGTLETSVAKLLPVDPRTLGYATSGKAEALPAIPDMNGAVVDVTAAQAQYVLDGAYGPIDGKTINFTESINDTLILGRASKYDGSKTVYRHGSHAGEALSYADFIAYKNQSVWTESCYYERTVENVTFTANKGVTVKNFEADGGAHIYAGTAPVYDYVRDTGSWVTEGSCYFKRAILKNITFKGLTFKAKTDINTSESTTVYDGFTFKDCTFDLGTTADGNQAIRYYNENNNGNVKNLVVEGCTFKTCSQGVYTMQVKGITVKDSTFTQTGHNAIAIQSQGGDKGPCNHGEVVITGNTMVNIGDRAIRFNVVAAGTTITITGNTAAYGDGTTATDKQCIKAETLAEGVTTTVELNNWNNYAVAANKPLTETVAKIGTTDYKSLEDATEAAQGSDVITIVGYTSNMTAPDGWKFETADGVTTLVADPVLLKGADGKFHIASCDDLLLFRKMVNEKGMYFLGETVVLDKDIDMVSVENWTPIGNAPEKKFAGTFDGQNHTISGLKITGGSYVGLFGYLGAATVQNVALVGANVSGVKRVGALVGQIAGNATIKNCSLDATSSVAGSDSNTGGLIGEASGSIVVTLENLTNNAPVTNTESGTSRAAGILCQATSGASVTLKNCVNKGTITTNGGYAGGIVSAKQGGASLVFDGCSNTGTLANGTKGTGALLAWSCNGSSVTISNYSGDVANAIGWLSQDNYDHVFVINGVEHYIRVAKGGSGYTFASRYEAAQLMNKSYLQEIIGFFNYAKTVNPNFEGYPATPVEVLKSAYSTSDESIKGSLFNTDVSSGWPQLLSAYNVKSGKSLTADDFAVTWGTRDVLFMVSDPVTVVVTDTASAQAALDAATPNTTIIFKSGTYEPLFIRQTLEKSTRRSDLDKDGSYPAYLRSFKNLTLIAEVGAEVVSKGITAEAGLFWHASAPASNQAEMRPMGGFISYLALENVTIDGIAFDSTEQSAVTLRDNGAVPTRGNIMVDGLTIQNCTGRGVASNENIHFLAAGGGTNDQNFPGTEKKSFNNIVVKNCELDSYYQPISFNNATAVLNGLTVTGNTFSNNGNSNVLQLSNKVNSGAFVIENNLFKDLNGRVVRATNSTANWTITGNRLDKPIMYDDSGDLDLVKISVKAETVGAAVTESENDWNTGTLANGTYIANGDPALLPVARIGENKYYHSLQAAFDAAKDGETVKLLADVTVAGQLVAEKALTLDLGGKTVTSTYANGGYAFLTRAAVTVKNGTFAAGQARALSAYANLTLEDATITSELAGGNCCVAFSAANCVYTVVNTKIVGAYAIANFAHNATIAITGSTLEGSGCGLYHNGSNYGLKLTVSDTTINGAIDQAIGEGKDPSGVYLSGSSAAIANAANQNGAHGRHQATFTRCTIKGNTGVEVKYTDLTLEDCTVVATTKEPSYTQNNNGMAALGFAVVSTDNATGNATPKPEGTITITGADGSYTGLVGLGSLDSVKTGFADFEDAHYAVSGGTFSNAVLPEYCAAGFIPTANDDGTYGVKAGAYVAAIGTTGYETLEAALAAADAGATVKMLADVVLTEKQTIAKALVLDLNGKTISSTVNEFITIVSGGNLTIDDATNEGRIENTATSGSAIRIETGTVTGTVGGILTLTGGSILAHSSNDAAVYSQSRGGEGEKVTVSIKGGRIENDGTNSYAVKLGSNTGTINVTGGEIVGGQYGLYVFAGNVVNISGGTIRGNTGNAVYSGAQNKITISGGTLTPGGTAAALAIGGGSIGPQSCTVTVGREGGTVADVTIPSIDFKPGYFANMATVNLLSGIVQKFLNFDKMAVEKVSQGKDTLLVGTDITACLPGSDLLCQLDAASGLYEVVKLTVENAAAIVTHDDVETPYHTVEQACKAVTDGDTLTLKVDHTGSQTLSFSAKNVTVDLGGKTLTYTGATGGLSSALSFNQSTASDNTVTVKNGTIVANAQDATCVRAEMTGDLSKTLTVVFGENLTLTSGNTSRYGGVVFGTGARTASPCEKMTKGGLLVTEGEEVWIYGETATAFTHAKGSEVTLLNDWYDTDTKGTVKVPSSGTFASAKLNLNGHTISSYGVNPAVLMGMVGENEDTAAKTLEISGGTIKTFRHGAAVCGSNKTLTLDGVTLTTTGDKMYGLYANGTTSGNTVTLKNKSAVLSEKATGIYFPGAGTLTVEDSNVTGGVSGIEVRAGVLNVSGTSVIASTAMEFSFTNNDNGTTTTGAAVAAVKHTVGNDLAVTITGGTFKGPRGFYANDPNVAKPGKVTVSISGGVFSTDVEKKYLADGCKTVQQTIDGTLYYVVGPAITQIGVTLGGKKKEMPFPDAWLADNIGADASSWTMEALEEKAANELAKWQCYLFGLDPSKKDAKVVATAGQGTDEAIPLTVANADASASPLVKDRYVTVAYVLMGSNDGTAWTPVATSDKRDGLAIPLTGTPYKFYRVDVTVTSAEGN